MKSIAYDTIGQRRVDDLAVMDSPWTAFDVSRPDDTPEAPLPSPAI
jgi:hypothetical protein